MTNELTQHRPNIEQEAVDVLTSKLKKGSLIGVARFHAQLSQRAEDLVWMTMEQRLISQAKGVFLDFWGSVVGVDRGGLTDGEYRRFIRARIAINGSLGEIERLIALILILTDADEAMLTQLYPAGLWFQYQAPLSLSLSTAARERVKAWMKEAKAAGVKIHYIVEYDEGAFGFEDDDDALGFDEGGLAEII